MTAPRGFAVHPTGMCPYCGEEVPVSDGLTALHHVGLVETRRECSGSQQVPRCAESDARPLWNGTSNGRFRG